MIPIAVPPSILMDTVLFQPISQLPVAHGDEGAEIKDNSTTPVRDEELIPSVIIDSNAFDIEMGGEEEKAESIDHSHNDDDLKKESLPNTMACTKFVMSYLLKMRGTAGPKPTNTPLHYSDILVSAVLSFTGILLTAVCDYWFLMRNFQGADDVPVKMLIGSFGASAVLSFDAYTSPLAQPRNLIMGHIVSSVIGVCIRLFSEAVAIDYWVAGPLAVAVAVIGMRLTRCVHPPGGATALIAVIGGPSVAALGFGYVLTCAGAAVISLAVAVVFNNMVPWRQYPTYWI